MSKSVNVSGHFDPSIGLIKELEEVKKTLLPMGSPSKIEREIPDASAELFPAYQLQSLWMNSLAPKYVSNSQNQPTTMEDRIILLMSGLEEWLESLTKKAASQIPPLLQEDLEKQTWLTGMLQTLLPLLQEDQKRREWLTKMLQTLLPLLQEDGKRQERLDEMRQAFIGP